MQTPPPSPAPPPPCAALANCSHGATETSPYGVRRLAAAVGWAAGAALTDAALRRAVARLGTDRLHARDHFDAALVDRPPPRPRHSGGKPPHSKASSQPRRADGAPTPCDAGALSRMGIDRSRMARTDRGVAGECVNPRSPRRRAIADGYDIWSAAACRRCGVGGGGQSIRAAPRCERSHGTTAAWPNGHMPRPIAWNRAAHTW